MIWPHTIYMMCPIHEVIFLKMINVAKYAHP